jgi:formamidopyrimidine-DNA glycosylase
VELDMPELPEVETIKEALKRSVEGAKVLSVEVRSPHLREQVPTNLPQLSSSAQILRIYRLAKYIIIDLNNGYSFILHLGMSGRIKILESESVSYEKHDHVILHTTKGLVIYNDARRFGLFTIDKTDHLQKNHLFEHLGLDPFDEQLTATYLENHFKQKQTAIKIVLLDQSIINGIGNIYASEALYEARISPLRKSSSLTHTDLEVLINAIRKTLTKAIKAGGSTLKDYRKPDGSMGYFQNQHCVYNKEGQRCPDCTCSEIDGGIKRITQGGRSTFYCGYLQK